MKTKIKSTLFALFCFVSQTPTQSLLAGEGQLQDAPSYGPWSTQTTCNRPANSSNNCTGECGASRTWAKDCFGTAQSSCERLTGKQDLGGTCILISSQCGPCHYNLPPPI